VLRRRADHIPVTGVITNPRRNARAVALTSHIAQTPHDSDAARIRANMKPHRAQQLNPALP
jgi:hypothetical protein